MSRICKKRIQNRVMNGGEGQVIKTIPVFTGIVNVFLITYGYSIL